MASSLRSIARVATRVAATRSTAAAATKLSSAVVRSAPLARSFRACAPRLQAEYEEYDESYGAIAAVTQRAPAWRCTALVDGEFKQVSSEDYKGKWLVLFFYPLDFTFVCPTEIRAFSDRVAEFEALGAKVVGASIDSEYAHLAWTKQPRKEGGLGPMKIPLLADVNKSISRSYGVLLEKEGIALRGLFLIDPEGILRQSTINDLPVGRSVDETLRLLQAFQFHAKHGEVCPSDWKPGQDAMKTDNTGLKKYFEKRT